MGHQPLVSKCLEPMQAYAVLRAVRRLFAGHDIARMANWDSGHVYMARPRRGKTLDSLRRKVNIDVKWPVEEGNKEVTLSNIVYLVGEQSKSQLRQRGDRPVSILWSLLQKKIGIVSCSRVAQENRRGRPQHKKPDAMTLKGIPDCLGV
jgi:hypothetical protein